MTRVLHALVHQEGKWFVAVCPEVGVTSQGLTIEEAVMNVKEATELYLEDEPLPEASDLLTFQVTGEPSTSNRIRC